MGLLVAPPSNDVDDKNAAILTERCVWQLANWLFKPSDTKHALTSNHVMNKCRRRDRYLHCFRMKKRPKGPRCIGDAKLVDAVTKCENDSARNLEGKARRSFIRRLSNDGIWVPRVQRPPSYQTLIIFDWDDTLLCTSYLRRFAICGLECLPSQMQSTMKAVEDLVLELLELAIDNGQTFIITNAKAGWVETSAKFWAPSLVSVLQKVQVMSARSRYETEFPDDATRWKSEAFLDVTRGLNNQVLTNLISLGDSEHEREATQIMGQEFRQATVKFVKFTPQPSPIELLQQLVLVNKAFREIVGKGNNLSIKLKRQP